MERVITIGRFTSVSLAIIISQFEEPAHYCGGEGGGDHGRRVHSLFIPLESRASTHPFLAFRTLYKPEVYDLLPADTTIPFQDNMLLHKLKQYLAFCRMEHLSPTT